MLDYVGKVGGASSISRQFYEDVKNDENNQWIFLTNKEYVSQKSNIKRILVNNANKTFLHRFYFETFKIPNIINNIKPDLVLSLQNLGVKPKQNQILYIHQALPFQNKLWELSNNPITLVKMLLMKYKLIKDIKKSNHIIVQTNYMKKLIEKYNNNIIVNLPNFNFASPQTHKDTKDFLYPTNAQKYKGLNYIVDFARILKKNKQNVYINLTLIGNENKYIENIRKIINKEQLAIRFIGRQNSDEMNELYKLNNLLFTSQVESLGLPLIEAAHYGCKIFAYETDVTKEVLKNYKFKVFFNKSNIESKYKEFLSFPPTTIGENINGLNINGILRTNHIIK